MCELGLHRNMIAFVDNVCSILYCYENNEEKKRVTIVVSRQNKSRYV